MCELLLILAGVYGATYKIIVIQGHIKIASVTRDAHC